MALLGLFVSAVRGERDRPRPGRNLGLVALAASVVSVGIFIATFNWLVVSSG